MRYFHKTQNKFWRPVLNTDKLPSLLPPEHKESASGELVPVVDLLQHGYAKLLAKGRIPGGRPFIVKARYVSRRAEQKVKEAGGVVKLVA